jgi:hypothetical protein
MQQIRVPMVVLENVADRIMAGGWADTVREFGLFKD